MKLVDSVLISIVAGVDALHYPLRSREGNTAVNAWRGQHDFFKHGLFWESGTRGASARKAEERAVDSLVEASLLATAKVAGLKTPALRPTDRGDDFARALLGFAGMQVSLEFMGDLASYDGDVDQAEEGQWVPESLPARIEWGEPGHEKRMAIVETCALPALWRHWVEANTTGEGHAWYRLTAAGRAALKAPPEPIGDLPKADDKATAVYRSALAAAFHSLQVDPPRNRNELGQIPLPSSMARRGNGGNGSWVDPAKKTGKSANGHRRRVDPP